MGSRGSERLSLSLEKRQPRGNLIDAHKYLQGGCQGNGARFFSLVPATTRGNRQKVMRRKFHFRWNITKNFTMPVTMHCNRLPRAVVESPSPEMFQNHLDAIWCHVL